MKLLFLGAGATGGYFGGHLAKAGVDVTFLVRPRRRDQLARDGIRIESATGNLATPVKAITRDEIVSFYDVIIVSAKAYDLAGAIEAIRPAVGAQSLVLPLLNGMKHLDTLDAAFGAPRVLGGTCHISVTLAENGTIRQLGELASLTQGPRFSEQQAASAKLHETLAQGIEAHHSDNIILAMWEKWFFLAAFAAATCLMRATVRDIVRAEHGATFTMSLLNECIAIARANGHAPQTATVEFARTFLTDPSLTLAASMLRDIQRGGAIEADQIVGDIIRRGRQHGLATPLLDIAYLHLQSYENQRSVVEAIET
ncbi:MAG: ketopantoate reductase family protein [Proteobacteria bacterium]|nr:ketopantoate reductase family protein [Pseudomonadota bacterium]